MMGCEGGNMYEYKSEILKTGFKWVSDKASEEAASEFTDAFNKKAAEGCELVAYSYMATSTSACGAFLVTYRKEIGGA